MPNTKPPDGRIPFGYSRSNTIKNLVSQLIWLLIEEREGRGDGETAQSLRKQCDDARDLLLSDDVQWGEWLHEKVASLIGHPSWRSTEPKGLPNDTNIIFCDGKDVRIVTFNNGRPMLGWRLGSQRYDNWQRGWFWSFLPKASFSVVAIDRANRLAEAFSLSPFEEGQLENGRYEHYVDGLAWTVHPDGLTELDYRSGHSSDAEVQIPANSNEGVIRMMPSFKGSQHLKKALVALGVTVVLKDLPDLPWKKS